MFSKLNVFSNFLGPPSSVRPLAITETDPGDQDTNTLKTRLLQLETETKERVRIFFIFCRYHWLNSSRYLTLNSVSLRIGDTRVVNKIIKLSKTE